MSWKKLSAGLRRAGAGPRRRRGFSPLGPRGKIGAEAPAALQGRADRRQGVHRRRGRRLRPPGEARQGLRGGASAISRTRPPRGSSPSLSATCGRPASPSSADEDMVRAARAILDPILGSGGARIAWDAMLSPEATAAMVRKACLETGGELVSTRDRGNAPRPDPSERAVRCRPPRATEGPGTTQDAADDLERDQLGKAIRHADYLLQSTYRLERSGPILAGFGIEKVAERAAEKGGVLQAVRLHSETQE